jgi:hypothetical protein
MQGICCCQQVACKLLQLPPVTTKVRWLFISCHQQQGGTEQYVHAIQLCDSCRSLKQTEILATPAELKTALLPQSALKM